MHLILFQIFLNSNCLQMYSWPTYRPTPELSFPTFSTYSFFFGIYLMLFLYNQAVLNGDISVIYLKSQLVWNTMHIYLIFKSSCGQYWALHLNIFILSVWEYFILQQLNIWNYERNFDHISANIHNFDGSKKEVSLYNYV